MYMNKYSQHYFGEYIRIVVYMSVPVCLKYVFDYCFLGVCRSWTLILRNFALFPCQI